MATWTTLTEDDVRGAIDAYALGDLRSFSGVAAGTVNSSYAVDLDAGRHFLRLYEEQDAVGAAAEAELLAHLAARGVATPPPVVRRDGTFVGEVRGKPAALFPWRDGDVRCLATVTPADTAQVGGALAVMHRAGEGATLRTGRFGPPELAARIARIAAAPDPAIAALAGPLGEKLGRWASARDPALPRGLVHGDLFRDNVLFRGAEIAALLDFESASEGPLVYDVAVALLAWCYRDDFVGPLAAALVGGYVAARPMSVAERRGLHAEACFAAIRFTITRVTDAAMRPGPPRRDKDWRRFAARLASLEGLGPEGLAALVGARL